MALLEAEIAHLRAQLRAGPDEKDKQLINLRRRVLVLSAQLNKAVQAKRTVELGLGRLQDLVNVSSPCPRPTNSMPAPNKLSSPLLISKQRTLRHIVKASEGGPRFADKALSMREDNTLRYRPSDGPLPPSAPWAVGDVCRVPSLQTGEMVPAVIEHLEPSDQPGGLLARVRFLQYDDMPIVEVSWEVEEWR